MASFEREDSLRDFLEGLSPSQEFVFRGCRYRLCESAEDIGIVPAPDGLLQWTGVDVHKQADGLAFIVKDRYGAPINLLRLRTGWQTDNRQEFLPGLPLWGGRITFVGSGDPASPTIFIDDWQEALLLSRRTGWTAIACLSLENLPLVAREWAEDNPGELCICYNGTANETDNPQLRAAYKVFVKGPPPAVQVPAHLANRAGPAKPGKPLRQMMKSLIEHRAWLVPAGPNDTFTTIDARLGKQGLLDHLTNQRAAQKPWPLRQQHPQLDIVHLPVAWPAPLDGRTLLDQLMLVIRRYVSISEDACLVTALWVLMTYATEAFRHLPLLAATSPEFGCGKTTWLFLLQFLCRRSLGLRGTAFMLVSRGNGSRSQQQGYEETRETLLIDEAQTMFHSAHALERLETSFDSYELGVVTLKQEQLVRRQRRGAAALVYREKSLPGRLASRCVHINLQRQLPDEAPHGREALLTEPALGELTLLRAMMRRWASDHLGELKEIQPPSLGWADPRADDVWRALLKIAFAIDEDTGRAVLSAAADFVCETEKASAGRELLSCIAELLEKMPTSAINSTDLCNRLCENTDWPWKARGLNTTSLAQLLRPYDIKPSPPSRIDGKTLRSYRRHDIERALARYSKPRG